jgi:hypothetical protein
MPVYMVDRSLPGVTMDQLAAAQKAAIETSRRFTESGKPPPKLPFNGIVEAMDLTPKD